MDLRLSQMTMNQILPRNRKTVLVSCHEWMNCSSVYGRDAVTATGGNSGWSGMVLLGAGQIGEHLRGARRHKAIEIYLTYSIR